MKLMTEEIRKALPKLYETENLPPREKVVIAKFFFPAGRGTWYAVEFDGEDSFFGFVKSPLDEGEDEWGYFSLSEMESLKVRGLRMERDLYWKPVKFADIEDGKVS